MLIVIIMLVISTCKRLVTWSPQLSLSTGPTARSAVEGTSSQQEILPGEVEAVDWSGLGWVAAYQAGGRNDVRMVDSEGLMRG